MIAKLQWKPKKSTEAPFVVDVPDVFSQAFVMEKDSKRFPKSGGWGYALFNYDAASDTFTRRRQPFGLRQRLPHGGESEGLHLPPVPEALISADAVRQLWPNCVNCRQRQPYFQLANCTACLRWRVAFGAQAL